MKKKKIKNILLQYLIFLKMKMLYLFSTKNIYLFDIHLYVVFFLYKVCKDKIF